MCKVGGVGIIGSIYAGTTVIRRLAARRLQCVATRSNTLAYAYFSSIPAALGNAGQTKH